MLSTSPKTQTYVLMVFGLALDYFGSFVALIDTRV